MRVAILILTLILGAIMFMQTFVVYGLGSAIGEEAGAAAGAVGLLVALLWLVAAAFVIGMPMVSVIAFGFAGLLGFGVSGEFPDMGIWGGISLALGFFAFLGHRGKKKQQKKQAALEAEQRARDERLETLLTQQQQASSQ